MHATTSTSPARLLVAIAALALIAVACLPAGTRGTSHPAGDGSGALAPSQAASLDVPSGPTPIPSFVPPTPTPAPTFLVYTVVKGDNLNTIAHKFGTTARSIAFWNRAAYPSLDPDSATYRPGFVQVGWTLALIPDLTVDEADLPDPASSGDAEPVESEDAAATAP